ncbi:hypothetical protein NEMBOFW57_009730 [Staphylotrichum longicolle]|uniref:Stress-response A/B barrel domain-containing protein n=1 Tax=Staphylotrichum longicolle TaxID=669026 RepID=A0AAD4EPZ4_9PEZI|nr:hypothetical protein NEMBOFW57_009730 [Staphylotrichum longicolle]
MTVIHVVLFQFKASAEPEDVKAVRTTHQDFVKSIGEVLEKPVVVDFSDNVY